MKATNATGTAGSTGTDAGVDRPITVGTAGVTGGGGSTPNIVGTGGTTGAGGTGGACTPTYTCDPVGGRYCNTIGNGCKGQQLDCGACSGDATCSGGATSPGVCIGGPSCPAITCTSGGGAKYCGKVGNGCGEALDCGACPPADVQRRRLRARELHAAGLRHPGRRPVLRQDRRRLRQDDRLRLRAPQTCGGGGVRTCAAPIRTACRSPASRWAASTAATSATAAAARSTARPPAPAASPARRTTPARGWAGPCSGLQCQIERAGE